MFQCNNKIINPTENEITIINQLLSNLSNSDKQQIINKLQIFIKFVMSENQKHNLIGKSTIEKIWTRHIIDSLQLIKYCDESVCHNIVDLGSGAGFPAIVLAITMNKNIIMIEKSPVKANFLNSVITNLQLDNAKVLNKVINKQNIKNLLPENTYITSRAFKSLGEILELINSNGNVKKLVLLKGQNFQQEIDDIPHYLINTYKMEITESINKGGVIVKILSHQEGCFTDLVS